MPEVLRMDEEHAREIAVRILNGFEELLDEYNIVTPSVERAGDSEEACLYGSVYYALEDAVVDILVEEVRGKDGASPSNADGIDGEARRRKTAGPGRSTKGQPQFPMQYK